MSITDDAGKKLLTDDEIEWLEDQGVDIDDPDAVDKALQDREEEILVNSYDYRMD